MTNQRLTSTALTAGFIQAAVVVLGLASPVAVAHADPPTPAEASFLQDVRSHAPNVGETDAQLLSDGQYACHNRAIGISTTAMGVSPVVAQWALADLCPRA